MRNLCKIILCYLLLTQAAYAVTTIKNIRIWPNSAKLKIVFDLNTPTSYKVYALDNPKRIVIDINNARLTADLKQLSFDKQQITSIRSGIHPNNMVRIVLDLAQNAQPTASLLVPDAKYGHRLAVDLQFAKSKSVKSVKPVKPGSTAIPVPLTATATKPQIKPLFIVAIDAGHGGDDPGAVGIKGTREKDVALAIAKELAKLINKQPGMRAVLTRDGDYYLGLRERIKRARNKKAQLFLSIHADGFNRKNAHGASVFTLSSKRASSEAARWLAASENRADLVGGLSLRNKSDDLASVLLDLSQTASARASNQAAKHILKALGKTTSLHKKNVEKAGFMVLRAPDIPSVLIETGFISNPNTERKLKDRKYQQQIANAIMRGVKEYYKSQTY